MTIRPARPEDAPALQAIYAHYIHTPVTFAYDLPSPEDFGWNLVQVMAKYPYLVAREGEELLGYAYAHPLRAYAAYEWNAELTIYLHPRACRRGTGSRLYGALLDLLRLQGVRNVYGCVTSPNPPSFALHEKLGFRWVGGFHQAGYKSGAWQDVAWFEKQIAPCQGAPEPLVPFLQLEERAVEEVLRRWSGEG